MSMSWDRLRVVFLSTGILLVSAAGPLSAQSVAAETEKAYRHVEAGRMDAALGSFRRCIELEPGNLNCLGNAALLAYLNGRNDGEALQLATAMLSALTAEHDDTTRREVHATYGVVLRQAGVYDRFEEARKHLLLAQRQTSDDEFWRVRISTALSATNAVLDAVAQWSARYSVWLEEATEAMEAGAPAPARKESPQWDTTWVARYKTLRTDNTLRTDWEQTFYRVREIVEGEDGSLQARIAASSLDRLQGGQSGQVFATNPGEKGWSPQPIGTAQVIEGGEGPLVSVQLGRARGKAHELRPGDLVSFGSAYLWPEKPSVILSLARQHIVLTPTDPDAPPYYDVAMARILDGSELPGLTIARMANDIRAEAARLQGEALSSDLNAKAKAWRFSGLRVIEALERTLTGDIQGFLNQLDLNPEQFRGRDLPLFETYARWIRTGRL